MKSILLRCCWLSCCLWLLWPLMAQDDTDALAKPRRYVRPFEGMERDDEVRRNDNLREGTPWIVTVRREGVLSYETYAGSEREPLYELPFGAQYFVGQEVGPFVSLYRDSLGLADSGRYVFDWIDSRFSDSAKAWMGWVDKRDLLLWQDAWWTPPDRTNRGGEQRPRVIRKAVAVNTLLGLRNLPDGSAWQPGVLRFFRSPERNKRTRRYEITDLKRPLPEVLFIYDHDRRNGAYLLGTEPFLQPGDGERLLGWVDKKQVVVLESPLMLQPNCDPGAVEERYQPTFAQRPVIAACFPDTTSAISYQQGAPALPLWQEDTSLFMPRPDTLIRDTCYPGSFMRLPVLAQLKPDLYRVGIVGAVEVGSEDLSRDIRDTVAQVIGPMAKRRDRLNVVFVVDGTQGMGPYFPAVADAIEGLRDSLREATAADTYFGVVVYRDDRAGIDLIDVPSMAPAAQALRVSGFLRNPDLLAKASRDADPGEAMYYGLLAAVQQTEIDTGATNLVVLVGDAGNHYRNTRSQVNKHRLANLLYEHGAHLLAFQVRREADLAYANFTRQAEDLMLGVALRTYDSIMPNLPGTLFGELAVKFPIMEEVQPAPPGRSEMMLREGWIAGGVVKPADNRTALHPGELTADIISRSMDAYRRLRAPLRQAEEIAKGRLSGKIRSYVQPTLLRERLQGVGCDEDDIARIMAREFPLYVEGVAPVQGVQFRHPWFMPCLLLSREELASLVLDLEQFAYWSEQAYNDSLAGRVARLTPREYVIDIWGDLVRKHLGKVIMPEAAMPGTQTETPPSYVVDRGEVEDWTLGQITRIVFGVPTADPLGRFPLKDLSDAGKVSDKALQIFLDEEVWGKADDLKRMLADPNPQNSLQEGAFFWVPRWMLP